MAGKPGQLSEKHWKALRLFEQGGHSRQEIANAIGVGIDYFNHLVSGDVSVAGQVALLFKEEWQRVEDKRDENIKRLVKENTEIVQATMNRVAKELQSKKKLSHEEKKLLNMYNNSLATNTPAVSIKNLSYSYVSGLTAEDLMHEFAKLKTVAEASFNRRGVPGPGSGESGSLPAVDEQGSGLAKDS